jgi:hypothetical protein
MAEQKVIILSKDTGLAERISLVSKEITKWLESLEEPFNMELDVMRLAKCEGEGSYTYHYVIDRSVR